jgi:cell shape-determining protein MreC
VLRIVSILLILIFLLVVSVPAQVVSDLSFQPQCQNEAAKLREYAASWMLNAVKWETVARELQQEKLQLQKQIDDLKKITKEDKSQ